MSRMKTEINVLYDVVAMSDLLQDLRKPNGKTLYSLKKLSDKILEKTGVYISDSQLGKYENADKKEIMNINNLLALSEFYGVSMNYLLGKADCKKADNEEINRRIGLSDDAIKMLEKIKKLHSAQLSELLSSIYITDVLDDIAVYKETVQELLKIRTELGLKPEIKAVSEIEAFEDTDIEVSHFDALLAQYKKQTFSMKSHLYSITDDFSTLVKSLVIKDV